MGQKKKGNGQRYELKGRRFGRLLVLHIAKKKSFRNWQWVCQCSCGNKTTVSATRLVKGNTVSCGCFRREAVSKRRRYLRPYESSYNLLVIDNNKRKNKHPIELTYEEFLTFTKIKFCHYCGDAIKWQDYRKGGEGNTGYNLDRMDPTLGYTKSNCVVCCGTCKWMKWRFSYETFVEQVKKISNNLGEI